MDGKRRQAKRWRIAISSKALSTKSRIESHHTSKQHSSGSRATAIILETLRRTSLRSTEPDEQLICLGDTDHPIDLDKSFEADYYWRFPRGKQDSQDSQDSQDGQDGQDTLNDICTNRRRFNTTTTSTIGVQCSKAELTRTSNIGILSLATLPPVRASARALCFISMTSTEGPRHNAWRNTGSCHSTEITFHLTSDEAS